MQKSLIYRRHHKVYARVKVHGKWVHLGRYGSDESHAKFKQLAAEFASGPKIEPTSDIIITVTEVLAAYIDYAKEYYGDAPRGRHRNMLPAIRAVEETYGSLPAADFGPKKLKAVRQVFVDAGNCRSYVNRNVQCIVAIFSWAAEEELVGGNQVASLREVRGLRKGRSAAPEGKPVTIVSQDTVDTTLDELTPVLQAMVRLQLLTGMRPGEVCRLTPGEVNRSSEVWLYEPSKHKTDHLDHKRTVAIGPKAQRILMPYLLRADDAPCFSPKESMRQTFERRADERTTPMSCGTKPKSHTRQVATLAKQYDANTYRRAVHRACDRAGIDRWSPNRLRHTRATEVREQYGLDAVQAVLGHKHARISEVYGELNTAKAVKIAAAIG